MESLHGISACRLDHHPCHKGSNKTWQRSNAHDNTLEESAMRLRCHIEDNSSQQGDGCPRSSRKDEKNNGAQCRLNVDCQIEEEGAQDEDRKSTRLNSSH